MALDPRYLRFHSISPSVIRGVIAISGIYEVTPGFDYAFGGAEARAEGSPNRFVRSGAPPFLVVHGGRDAQLVLRQTGPFVESLKQHGVEVETEVYPDDDHSSIIALASVRESPLLQRIVAFVKKHS
ncbi:MAG: prolyl oligopeptidase family serine peptidase [Bryobacterales bacterium]|nr:prolyl oligopeptidase family serine peptidase [Bryobacterales bacterium]